MSSNMVSDADVIEGLMQLGGPGVSWEYAKDLLAKHNGDANAAATAILDGSFEEPTVTSIATHVEGGIVRPVEPQSEFTNALGALNAMTAKPLKSSRKGAAPAKEQHVIDLTGDTEAAEFEKAMQASLESVHQTPRQVAGPLNRGESTALVPYNPAGAIMSHDDDLSRALEASYNSSMDMASDVYVDLPFAQQVRQPTHPVALRTTSPLNVHVALLLQILCNVPSFHYRLKNFRSTDRSSLSELDLGATTCLQRLLTFAEHTQRAYLNIDDALSNLGLLETERVQEPGEIVHKLYKRIAGLAESVLVNDTSKLFFTYGGPVDRSADVNGACSIEIDVRPSEEFSLDLNAFLTRIWGDQGQILTEVADTLGVYLRRPVDSPPKRPFTFPTQLYLDQYMAQNYQVSKRKREELRENLNRIHQLTIRKTNLTNFNGKDNLKDLKSSLYYLDNVADDGGDSTARINTATKLRKIIADLELHIANMDSDLSMLKTNTSEAFAVPELQQYKYDLCGVILHDGLFGRLHLYSYIKSGGKWWKTVDHTVTEVPEETVLTDSTGLHLGAGPVMLFYVRDLKMDEGQWPQECKTAAKIDNTGFRRSLPEEIGANLEPDSPLPSSPSISGEFQTPPESQSVEGGDTDVDEVMEI